MTNKPDILNLSAKELIEWCNERKKQMGLSNAKLAKLTNVPEGTLDRIFTGKNPEFRYSTIQPIVSLLVGYKEETPQDETSDFYTNTIDGYKLILDNKNHIIDGYKLSLEKLEKDIEYLKNADKDKQKIIEDLIEQNKWMQQFVDKKKMK